MTSASPVALTIELDAHAGAYAPGQAVSGRVRAAAGWNVSCERLKVECVPGEGASADPDGGTRRAHKIWDGHWSAGVPAEHPFVFPAPIEGDRRSGGPRRARWRVQAAAHVGDEILRSRPVEIVVDRGRRPPRTRPQVGVDRFGPRLRTDHLDFTPAMSGLVVGSIGFLFCAPALVTGAWTIAGAGALLLLAGIWIFWSGSSRLRAERQLGDVHVRFRHRAHPGATIPVEVSLFPRERYRPDFVVVSLVAYEHTPLPNPAAGDGDDVRPDGLVEGYYRTGAVKAAVWQWPTKPTARSPGALHASGTIRVPADGPVTLAEGFRNLAWVVGVRIPVPGEADWTDEFALEVTDRAGAA